MVYIPRHLSYRDLDTQEDRFVIETDLQRLAPPLIILGDPGLGKSGLFRSLAASDARFELITARAFKRRGAKPTEGRILLIDALDELPGAQDQDPVQEVLAKLAEVGWPPFYLSCRANDWRNVAQQSIREDYGHAPLELRLAPFTQDDAVAFLAAERGQKEARALVRRMDEQGIADFYGNPLMLQLVSRLVDSPGGLPSDRAELFLRAAHDLRQEQNPDRPHSPLTTLSADEALNAAGAASACLILTGSEAINLGSQGARAEGDLQLADLSALPGADKLRVVTSSMLFQRRDGGDRVGPFHRALAEFLGARWLSAQAETASAERILALMTFQGGVPASLRGMYAWLSYFSSRLRPAVVSTDPYGVLRYGDCAKLSTADAALLLKALEGLAQIDPYFASEDRKNHSATALTQAGMAADLRRILLSPETPFQLKSVVLLALRASEAAPELVPDLIQILMSEGPSVEHAEPEAFSFHERAASLDILVDLVPRKDWPARVGTLLARSSEDDRRLAVDVVRSVGCQHFRPDLIAKSVLAYTDLLAGRKGREAVNVSGDLWLLSRALPDHLVAEVLDAIVALKPETEDADWRSAYEFGGFVDFLVSRVIGTPAVTPLRLLSWLRLIHDRTGGQAEARQAIELSLIDQPEVRQSIQHQLVFVEGRAEGTLDWLWRIYRIHPALGLRLEDVVHHLHPENFPSFDDEMDRERWRRLVAQRHDHRGLPPEVREAARLSARGDPALEAFLVETDRKQISPWDRRERHKRWARRRQDRREFERRRREYQGLATEIAEGSWVGLGLPAGVYLNQYIDVERDFSPRARLEAWVGVDLAQQMFAGFEAALSREVDPSPERVAESYAKRSGYKSTHVLTAGVCERVFASKSLSDLSEDVMLTVALGQIFGPGLDAPGAEDLDAAMTDWFNSRPDAWERLQRLTIEPQLRRRNEHITGLHRLLRDDKNDVVTLNLVVEWLSKFPNLPATVEAELLDFLSRRGQWAHLRQWLADHKPAVDDGLEASRTWLSIAFFADFDESRRRLDEAARADPELMWTIRRRGWPSEELGLGQSIGTEQLAWLVRNFRGHFPSAERSPGVSSGDSNPWDATDFLRGMIRRIASDTSDEAISALTELRAESNDGYLPFIQNACAQQLKARRDASFIPPHLEDITAVLRDGRPTTVADLRALALDAVSTVQARMNRDDVDQVSLFFDGTKPKTEEECRNSLVILLRDLIGHGVDSVPERLMPANKRADIVFGLDDLRLPVEAKGQWNAELWTAANDQLDARYAVEWRAQGYGIYLVFWFGADTPPSRKLKSPGRGRQRPQSPSDLRDALVARIPEHRRGQISVLVLDVSRRAGSGLIPASDDAALR